MDSVLPAFKQPLEGVVISEGETAVFVAVITGLFSINDFRFALKNMYFEMSTQN